jgi:hypothetical protein
MRGLAAITIFAVVGISLLATLGYGPTLFGFVTSVPGGDLTGHFVLGGVVSLVVNLAFAGRRWTCIGLVLGGVILEEVIQLYLPTRTFSVADLLASGAGVIIFGWLGSLRKKPNRDGRRP